MTDIEKITDHEDRRIARLTYQHRKLSADTLNLKEFTRPQSQHIQELEDVLWSMIDDRALPTTQFDDCLERWGETIGAPRPSTGLAASDLEAYRALIYAKIAENNSYGLHSDVLSILATLRASDIYVVDVYPAAIQVQYNDAEFLLGIDEIKQVLNCATLQIDLDVSTYTDNAFGFFGNTDVEGFSVGELGDAAA